MCRTQAGLQRGSGRLIGGLTDDIALDHWQLALVNVARMAPGPAHQPSQVAVRPRQIDGQLALFAVPGRHFDRFVRARDAHHAHPAVIAARAVAQRMAEANGWSDVVAEKVDLALLMLLSDHAEGDLISYDQMRPLHRRNANAGHAASVLQELGLFHDDGRPDFGLWAEQRTAALGSGIAGDVCAWLSALHAGEPRSMPRAHSTIRGYLTAVSPPLLAWSQRYDHLREVTPDDIKAVAGQLKDWQRHRALVALRSLFRFLKKKGRIFRDPTVRISPGPVQVKIPMLLTPGQLRCGAAFTLTAAGRVVLALAAIHAARPKDIPLVGLHDVDIANRRLTVGGATRVLDDPTRAIVEGYLAERRQMWPRTANSHLLISSQSAHHGRPVSAKWVSHQLRGLGATLNQIRFDRQLDEALTFGPDPLHLAIVFGVSQTTAVRFAHAAAQLLDLPLPRNMDWEVQWR